MTENKTQLISRLEAEVDRQIEVVVREFQNLEDSVLLRTTEEGGWSVIQNLEHLNFYYNYYNPTIKQALENATSDTNADTFSSGWFGGYFTKSMDYRGKKKIKAFKDYIPGVELDSARVISDFISNQEEMLRLLRLSKDYNLTKIKLPISLTKLIKMRLGDVFQFVIMHNERHIVQAQSRL